jgi:polyhydroxyalkanoate synthesis regulator phasin
MCNTLRIRNKRELLIAVQDLNALKKISDEVNDTIENIKSAIRNAKIRFHIPMGPANDLNGPNGGVTFALHQEREYKPDGIKKHLGDAAFGMFTEIRVKSTYQDTIRKMVDAACRAGSLSEEQAKEIVEEVGDEVCKIISRLSKAKEIQIPFKVDNPDELEYQLQSPRIVSLIENGFTEME